jgi:hypothetical protein
VSRPHELLIELAAGRPVVDIVDEAVVTSAEEHRVAGLLKTAVDGGVPPDRNALIKLNRSDALGWARNRLLLDASIEIAGVAAGLGIDVVFFKGVANETRWYSRLGERPAWDIDLAVAPWHRDRVRELLGALQPRHSLLAEPESSISRHLQSIDFGFHSLPVDLHLDVLKLEVASVRNPEAFFETASSLSVDGTKSIPVLGVDASLLLAALHLNKDRFRFLLGYVDLIRIANDPRLDFERALKVARGEGLSTSLQSTLAVAAADLGLPTPFGCSASSAIWNRAWPSSVRLLGSEGEVRFRYRQFLLPLLEGGRWGEVAASTWRRLFPTRYELRRNFPGETGPYVLRLIRGRFRHRLARFRQRKAHRLQH